MKQFTTERERERKKRREKKKQNNDQKMKKSKHKTKKRADRQTKKKSRERATFDEHVLRHTFLYSSFHRVYKGRGKKGEDALIFITTRKNTEDTRARKRKRSSTKPHTFLHRNERLFEEEDKGRGDSWSAILKNS